MIKMRAFFGNVVGNVSAEDGGRQQGPAFGRVGVIVSAAAQQQSGNSGAQSIRQQPNASDLGSKCGFYQADAKYENICNYECLEPEFNLG